MLERTGSALPPQQSVDYHSYQQQAMPHAHLFRRCRPLSTTFQIPPRDPILVLSAFKSAPII